MFVRMTIKYANFLKMFSVLWYFRLKLVKNGPYARFFFKCYNYLLSFSQL